MSKKSLKLVPWLGCFLLLLLGMGLGWFKSPKFPFATPRQKIQSGAIVAEIRELQKDGEAGLKRYGKDELDRALLEAGVIGSCEELSKLGPYIFGREYARGFLNSQRKKGGQADRKQAINYSFPIFSISGLIVDKGVVTMYAKYDGQPKSLFFRKEGGDWVLTTPLDGFGSKDVQIDDKMFTFTLFLLTDPAQQVKYSFDRDGMRRLLGQGQ